MTNDITLDALSPASVSVPGQGHDDGVPPSGGAVLADKTEHVSFAVGDQVFAFGMVKVLEIIRMPRSVAVPMTPSALLGLANLRGRVLPVLDFRTLAGLEARAADDATRVIVVDIGQIVGLVVDRVLRVMHVEDKDVEAASGMESLLGGDLLDGVVKQAGGALVQLVDPEKVVGLTFSMEDIRSVAEGGIGAADLSRLVAADVAEDEGGRLVSVALLGQNYGLPIEHVDEIVRVPEVIDSVPNTPAHVLGIINLRNRVLPLVCMRRMLGLSSKGLEDSNRVVVVQTEDASGILRRIGLVVDRVNEVLRVDPKIVSEVPDLLAAHGTTSEITAILRLDGGKRLLSVLNVEKMFARRDLEAVTGAETAAVADETMETDMTVTTNGDDRQAIVFQMIDQEFGIMVEHVKEILRVPETMNRVPKTAGFVEGMMNLRGGVLPVIDMRSRLGLSRQERSDRQRVIVLDLDGRRTGFVVDGVSEVLRMPADALIETPRLSMVQQDVLGQAVKLDGGARLILLVDPRKLVDAGELEQLDGLAA